MERKILRVKQLLENKYRNCKKINIKALEDKIQKTHKIQQKGRQEIRVERKIKRSKDSWIMEEWKGFICVGRVEEKRAKSPSCRVESQQIMPKMNTEQSKTTKD